MTKEISECVPRLRFPEFMREKWQYFPANTFFSDAKEKNYKDLDIPILAITQDNGAIPRTDINYNVITSRKSIKNYKIVQKGDFIISLRSFQGGIEYSKFDGLCSPAYIVLRKIYKHNYYNIFFAYFFKTKNFISILNKDLTGIRDGKIIPYTHFSKLYLPLPCIKEQQKIADCLSSLDELIEACEQKCNALKQHKKGLMQCLFPVEGETTPRWRFLEFRDSGEWKETRVSQLGEIITGKTPSTTNQAYWNGEYIWITPTDILSKKYISSSERTITSRWLNNKKALPINTILITCIASIGKNCILKKAGFCNQQINAIIPTPNYNSDFIYYIFDIYNHILITNAGITATRILPKSKFVDLLFPFPSLPEQQKIADCLSSLDDRIAAEEDRLAALREHKKGLMQQLFPRYE